MTRLNKKVGARFIEPCQQLTIFYSSAYGRDECSSQPAGAINGAPTKERKALRLWNSQHGFTMLELLVAIIIVILLATASIAMISRVETWANIAQAKAEIIQISMAVEMEKYDTGVYTLDLADLALPSAPTEMAEINARSWKGPYLKSDFLSDPWNNYYLSALNFSIPSGTTSNDFEANFTAVAGTDTMMLETENEKRIDSVTIALWDNLNETLIKTWTLNSPDLPKDYPITLSSNNKLTVLLAGEPGASLIVVFPNLVTYANKKNPYLIISRGVDKLPGGTGLNADIIWHSDYAGFRN